MNVRNRLQCVLFISLACCILIVPMAHAANSENEKALENLQAWVAGPLIWPRVEMTAREQDVWWAQTLSNGRAIFKNMEMKLRDSYTAAERDLSPAARDALHDQQARWLKQRQASLEVFFPDPDNNSLARLLFLIRNAAHRVEQLEQKNLGGTSTSVSSISGMYMLPGTPDSDGYLAILPESDGLYRISIITYCVGSAGSNVCELHGNGKREGDRLEVFLEKSSGTILLEPDEAYRSMLIVPSPQSSVSEADILNNNCGMGANFFGRYIKISSQ